MSNPEADPVADELQHMRRSIDELAARVGELAADNQRLRDELKASEAARTDLVAQAEHLIHELGKAREAAQSPKG